MKLITSGRLATKIISQYDAIRDRNDILRLEIQIFNDPMSGNLVDYLVSKYGLEYFYVVDLSGNHQLDGYIFAGIESSKNLYIFSLAVEVTHEKQGWCSKLLSYVISKATAKGLTHVNLHVELNNNSAQDLYQKFGFTKNLLVKNYYGPGKNGISMELRLESKIK